MLYFQLLSAVNMGLHYSCPGDQHVGTLLPLDSRLTHFTLPSLVPAGHPCIPLTVLYFQLLSAVIMGLHYSCPGDQHVGTLLPLDSRLTHFTLPSLVPAGHPCIPLTVLYFQLLSAVIMGLHYSCPGDHHVGTLPPHDSRLTHFTL